MCDMEDGGECNVTAVRCGNCGTVSLTQDSGALTTRVWWILPHGQPLPDTEKFVDRRSGYSTARPPDPGHSRSSYVSSITMLC